MQVPGTNGKVVKVALAMSLGLAVLTGSTTSAVAATTGRHITTLDGHGGTLSAAKAAPKAPVTPHLLVARPSRSAADIAAGVLRNCPC